MTWFVASLERDVPCQEIALGEGRVALCCQSTTLIKLNGQLEAEFGSNVYPCEEHIF